MNIENNLPPKVFPGQEGDDFEAPLQEETNTDSIIGGFKSKNTKRKSVTKSVGKGSGGDNSNGGYKKQGGGRKTFTKKYLDLKGQHNVNRLTPKAAETLRKSQYKPIRPPSGESAEDVSRYFKELAGKSFIETDEFYDLYAKKNRESINERMDKELKHRFIRDFVNVSWSKMPQSLTEQYPGLLDELKKHYGALVQKKNWWRDAGAFIGETRTDVESVKIIRSIRQGNYELFEKELTPDRLDEIANNVLRKMYSVKKLQEIHPLQNIEKLNNIVEKLSASEENSEKVVRGSEQERELVNEFKEAYAQTREILNAVYVQSRTLLDQGQEARAKEALFAYEQIREQLRSVEGFLSNNPLSLDKNKDLRPIFTHIVEGGMGENAIYKDVETKLLADKEAPERLKYVAGRAKIQQTEKLREIAELDETRGADVEGFTKIIEGQKTELRKIVKEYFDRVGDPLEMSYQLFPGDELKSGTHTFEVLRTYDMPLRWMTDEEKTNEEALPTESVFIIGSQDGNKEKTLTIESIEDIPASIDALAEYGAISIPNRELFDEILTKFDLKKPEPVETENKKEKRSHIISLPKHLYTKMASVAEKVLGKVEVNKSVSGETRNIESKTVENGKETTFSLSQERIQRLRDFMLENELSGYEHEYFKVKEELAAAEHSDPKAAGVEKPDNEYLRFLTKKISNAKLQIEQIRKRIGYEKQEKVLVNNVEFKTGAIVVGGGTRYEVIDIVKPKGEKDASRTFIVLKGINGDLQTISAENMARGTRSLEIYGNKEVASLALTLGQTEQAFKEENIKNLPFYAKEILRDIAKYLVREKTNVESHANAAKYIKDFDKRIKALEEQFQSIGISFKNIKPHEATHKDKKEMKDVRPALSLEQQRDALKKELEGLTEYAPSRGRKIQELAQLNRQIALQKSNKK